MEVSISGLLDIRFGRIFTSVVGHLRCHTYRNLSSISPLWKRGVREDFINYVQKHGWN
jgi:hypothetical protein